MNSHDANTLVETLLAALDPRTIYVSVIAPIEAAYRSFPAPCNLRSSNQALIGYVSQFVAHLYVHGVVPAVAMSEVQARQEAVHLMERAYSNGASTGFYAIRLDVFDSREDCMPRLFQQIAAAIAAQERTKYMAFIVAKFLDPADWTTRVTVTERLLDRSVLGNSVEAYGRGAIYELAQHIEDLVLCEFQTNAQVSQIVQGHGSAQAF